MLSVPFSIPFAKCHMHYVAEVFANLPADILPNADDMAGCPHLYHLTVVGDTVKRGMDGQPALAENSKSSDISFRCVWYDSYPVHFLSISTM